jgi:hypothetical protein
MRLSDLLTWCEQNPGKEIIHTEGKLEKDNLFKIKYKEDIREFVITNKNKEFEGHMLSLPADNWKIDSAYPLSFLFEKLIENDKVYCFYEGEECYVNTRLIIKNSSGECIFSSYNNKEKFEELSKQNIWYEKDQQKKKINLFEELGQ